MMTHTHTIKTTMVQHEKRKQHEHYPPLFQITLYGYETPLGFNVKRSTQGQFKNIASCVAKTGMGENVEKQLSCNTIKIVDLVKNDEIYVQEMGNLSGIYAETTSYFGLIKLS